MDIFSPVITVIIVHILAMVSPGPNFLISAKQGLNYPRLIQIATTSGIATGALIWVGLGFLGLSAIVTQSIMMYTLLKYIGAAYLIYLGVAALFSRKRSIEVQEDESLKVHSTSIRAFRLGLLTMLSNPKAAVYFVALFTTVIPPDTPMVAKVIIGIVTPLLTWAWFSLVATMFSLQQFRRLYTKFQHSINLLFGVVMVTLGLKIAFEQN